MKKRATMKDVAAAAGVSVMSVSYALRHHPSIPETTASRIREIARQMEYTPNPLVSALFGELRSRHRSAAPPLIAYLSFYAERSRWWSSQGVLRPYYEGAKARCEELGFAMELVEPLASNLSPKRLCEVLRYRNVVGLIVGAHPVQVPAYPFAWEKFPCVAMGYSPRVPPFHRVTLNHFQAMELALGRLSALGYRRIAIGLSSTWALTNQYIAAFDVYQRSIAKAERIAPFFISRYSLDPKVFGRKIERHRPDAFIDASGGFFVKAFASLGVTFPDEMAYATLNWHRGLAPFAGVNQNSDRIGATAVDLLVNRINFKEKGIPDVQTFTLVAGEWVDGPSAPPR